MNGGKSRVTFLVSIALCYFDDLLARTFLYSGTLCRGWPGQYFQYLYFFRKFSVFQFDVIRCWLLPIFRLVTSGAWFCCAMMIFYCAEELFISTRNCYKNHRPVEIKLTQLILTCILMFLYRAAAASHWVPKTSAAIKTGMKIHIWINSGYEWNINTFSLRAFVYLTVLCVWHRTAWSQAISITYCVFSWFDKLCLGLWNENSLFAAGSKRYIIYLRLLSPHWVLNDRTKPKFI